MKQSTLELSVIVPSKAGFVKIPEYGHQGSVFVEGRQDQRFGLRLRNDRADRVLAVISIDGVSVLDGTPCTPQSNGYVLPAFSSYDLHSAATTCWAGAPDWKKSIVFSSKISNTGLTPKAPPAA